MLRVAVATSLVLVIAQATLAQAPKDDARRADRVKADIVQHRALAAVHEMAAKCLESGKSEKECHERLARDCMGVGIGKHCGMRHRH